VQDVRSYDIGVDRFHCPVVDDPASSFQTMHTRQPAQA
jgi:hypothetical protein